MKYNDLMPHKKYLYLITFMLICVFLLNLDFVQTSFANHKSFVFVLILVAIALFYYYAMVNVIIPMKLIKKSAKKIKIEKLDEIIEVGFDKINPAGFAIEKSVEIIDQLSNDIKYATDFIEKIEKGQLDVSYSNQDSEIQNGVKNPLERALLSMREQLVAIAEKEKERNWATEGLAKFADILRVNDNDFESLYDNIILQVVNYVNANQGGLYIVNEDSGVLYLDLVSYYAYNRKKYFQQRFETKEGLIGQCYLEADTIYITELPAEYTSITSGVGEATPKCLLILPLKINETVYGILELAAFVPFKSYQIEFLKKLCENIASTVSNVKINEQTQKLLKESQLQAEYMRSQEEEMRQNLEELHATQEEMKRSEKVHLQEIERLQNLHEENMHQAQLKNQELKEAEDETKEVMAEMQASQEKISKDFQFLFSRFNEFNIYSKFDQLTSIRSTKKRNIEDYFNIIRNQIMTYSEDKMIVDAMKAFKSVFPSIGKDIPEAELIKMKANVHEYYENEFLPKLNANNEEHHGVEKFWDDDPRTILMQFHYISNNPNETGKKHVLDAADNSPYGQIHATYHPIIRNFLLTFGYYDIFLIDNETGHLVYSVFKEVDYTTSLLSGPYKNTNFAQVFREARNAQKKEFIKLVDFEPYDPSYTAPASFIATPIFDGDEKIGVLIFQMPIHKINSIMTGDSKWKEDGLGNSGETYLVGEDYKMRSISRFLIEDPVGYFNELQRIGYNETLLKRIRRLNTTILLQDVKTDAVINALRGNSDKQIVLDYRGIRVLSAYSKLEIKDVNWVICSDIDEEEVVESISYMKELAN